MWSSVTQDMTNLASGHFTVMRFSNSFLPADLMEPRGIADTNSTAAADAATHTVVAKSICAHASQLGLSFRAFATDVRGIVGVACCFSKTPPTAR